MQTASETLKSRQSDLYFIFWDAGNGGKLMPNTELEIAKHQVSELRVRLLQQQSIVLGLRREGGEKLEKATVLLDSMMDELIDLEAKWDRLVSAS